MDAQQRQVN